MGPSSSIPRDVSKGSENMCVHGNLHTDMHNSIIHNSRKVETTQIPTN